LLRRSPNNIDQRQAVENNIDPSITAITILSWDGLDIERDEANLVDHLQDVMDSVGYRMAAYPVN
jgi:hypothetical protein